MESFYSQNNIEEIEKNNESEKELIWQKKIEEVNHIIDRFEKPIDENIKETVVALSVNGLSTSGSCEGHIDYDSPSPWVDIAAPNEPKERFVGQEDICQKIAQRYGISIEEAIHNQKVFDEIIDECSEKGETEDYKRWKKENNDLLLKMQNILDIFYKDRDINGDKRLKLRSIQGMACRLYNGKIEKEKNNISEKEKLNMLIDNQQEMKDFGGFLKQRFFETDKSLKE